MVTAGVIVRLYVCVTVKDAASVTRTVKTKVPAAADWPKMLPFNTEKPEGRDPEARDQV
jgi:hypothetical protein